MAGMAVETREGPNAAPSAATQGAAEHPKTCPLVLRLRSLTLLLIFPVQQVAMQSDFLCDNQNQNGDHRHQSKVCHEYDQAGPKAYLIFVIFFTRAKFLENKIYTEKRQFFALNL